MIIYCMYKNCQQITSGPIYGNPSRQPLRQHTTLSRCICCQLQTNQGVRAKVCIHVGYEGPRLSKLFLEIVLNNFSDSENFLWYCSSDLDKFCFQQILIWKIFNNNKVLILSDLENFLKHRIFNRNDIWMKFFTEWVEFQ